MNAISPLRYPGGKQRLAPLLSYLIRFNGLEGGVYAEPFAGGAGAALSLLFSEHAFRIILNDADPSIYAMWKVILDKTEEFCRLIRDTPLTVTEWKRQKSIYSSGVSAGDVELGFSTFFLNRTNRSGIIKNAGPIGGFEQTGEWKIDARYNSVELRKRIERVALYRKRISIFGLDSVEFLDAIRHTPELFVYLDPPYYVKGCELYLNHYQPSDHGLLARQILSQSSFKWIMSYDDAPAIRRLYQGLFQSRLTTSYTATQSRKRGAEILIFGNSLLVPDRWRAFLPKVSRQPDTLL